MLEALAAEGALDLSQVRVNMDLSLLHSTELVRENPVLATGRVHWPWSATSRERG